MPSAILRGPAMLGLLAGTLIGLPAQAAPTPTDHVAVRIADCRVGFGGYLKVGHWTPIWVDVTGNVVASRPSVEVTTVDSDGVAVTTSVKLPIERESTERYWPTLLYIQLGRIGSPIEVALVSEEGIVLDRAELEPERGGEEDRSFTAMPATSELIVHFGSASIGLTDAFADRDARGDTPARRVVQLRDVDALPTDWFGYESVDVLLITTADLELSRRLAGDERRLAAIEKWLELGGRLLFCCGRNAPELITDTQPLARMVPGRFVDMARLPQTRGLESFAQTDDAIVPPGEQRTLSVPGLNGVAGQVDLYGRGNNLPLVVRQARGFGELVFVGVDLESPPLAEWSGRTEFLRRLLRPYAAELEFGSPQTLVSLGYDDLAGAVRQRLGRSFSSVLPITFSLVTVLVIGYLLLLGPLDYLLVHKLIRRPWVAWITFPLLVLATSGGVLWMAAMRRGAGGAQVNQAELVDVDLATGRVRGTVWATLYSPQARRFDLACPPRLPGDRPPEEAESLISWLGLPGSGLGGMHARGVELDLTRIGYRASAEHDALAGVPVLTASTKSFVARWNGTTDALLAADLTSDQDGLLVGSLTNQSGRPLHDACLLFGQWGYRLGEIEPGASKEVGPGLHPIQVKTLLARRARRSGRGGIRGSDRDLFSADRASTEELLNVMMFYEAVGGYSFAGMPNRYHDYCDLSRLLTLKRAVFVARVEGGGSQLVDPETGQPLTNQEGESSLFFRFVIPIEGSY